MKLSDALKEAKSFLEEEGYNTDSVDGSIKDGNWQLRDIEQLLSWLESCEFAFEQLFQTTQEMYITRIASVFIRLQFGRYIDGTVQEKESKWEEGRSTDLLSGHDRVLDTLAHLSISNVMI